MMTTEIITTCPFCGESHTLEVPFDGYLAWNEGALAQEAFPSLTPDEREMLISGICPECWEKTFG